MKTLVRILANEGFAFGMAFWLIGIALMPFSIFCWMHTNYCDGFMFGAVLTGVLSVISGVAGFCMLFHVAMNTLRMYHTGY